MATQATYLTSVRERLDEPVAQFWTDVELRRWINEAASDIARRTETIQHFDNVSVTANVQEYTLSTDLLRIHRVEWHPTGDQNVYPLEYMDYNELDSLWFTQKETSRGDPRVFTLWGFSPKTLVLYPTPGRAGVVKVYSFRLPASLSTTGSDAATGVDVPPGWEDLVVEYVIYQALLKDGDDKWQASKQLYDEKLDAMYQLTRRWSDQAGMIVSDLGNTMVPRWIYDFDYQG